MAWVQLSRELEKETFIRRHFDPEFFERAFHPRYLLELSERSPEVALAWVQVARELGVKVTCDTSIQSSWSVHFTRGTLLN
jgi:hypothetical protein